ncbi:MAG: hypothetical protein KDD48_08400, partial [Bdellovibrionales bacterium]|nr:hypothetical protein [Bdellovibrionales bacterium]
MNRPQAVNLTIWCVLANVFLWSQTLLFGFVWDDYPTVVSNVSLREWNVLWKAFLHDFWALHNHPQMSGYWRPLVTVVYSLIGHLFSFNAWIFHGLSISIHTTNAILVKKIFDELNKEVKYSLACFAMLLFAFHPVQSETVSFISALPDLLSALGGLWMTYCLLKTDSNLKRRMVFSSLGLVVALLSKESGLSFALLALVLTISSSRSRSQKLIEVSVWLSLASIYVALHGMVGFPKLSEFPGGALEGADRIKLVIDAFWNHIVLLVCPWTISPLKTLSLNVWDIWTGLKAGVLLMAVFFSIRIYIQKVNYRIPILMFWCFWLPVSFLFPLEKHMAARYDYLLVIPYVYILTREIKETFILFAIVCLFAIGSFYHAQKWKSDEKLWGTLIEYDNASSVVWNQWGVIRLKQNKFESAFNAFAMARSLDPGYQEAFFNEIVTLVKSQKLRIAMPRMEE